LPTYGTTCNNLDMALAIVQSDQASPGERVGAGAYLAAEGLAHGALVAGATLVACGSIGACAAVLETALGIGTVACRDGDCTNETKLVVGVARSTETITGEAAKVVGNQFWTRVIKFKGNLVYQRPDLINPNLSQGGLTNLQRMQQGLAPIGPDGARIQLHHMLQTMNGPIAEVTQTFHRAYGYIIHINPNTIGTGIDRAAFKAWKVAYWMNRAKDFID
ncbi:MAG: HNH/ENDO VII family nuclease, partial [Chloroflexota bacterium]